MVRTAGTAKLPSLGDSDLPPGTEWHAQQVGHPPRLLQLRRSRLRRDGKASVARRFRLATRYGMARTTSRTSSSSPPASPIPAPPSLVGASFQLAQACTPLPYWPRRGSNPHGDHSPRDFKSRASACFATRPLHSHRVTGVPAGVEAVGSPIVSPPEQPLQIAVGG
jgi:hypothetical protein